MTRTSLDGAVDPKARSSIRIITDRFGFPQLLHKKTSEAEAGVGTLEKQYAEGALTVPHAHSRRERWRESRSAGCLQPKRDRGDRAHSQRRGGHRGRTVWRAMRQRAARANYRDATAPRITAFEPRRGLCLNGGTTAAQAAPQRSLTGLSGGHDHAARVQCAKRVVRLRESRDVAWPPLRVTGPRLVCTPHFLQQTRGTSAWITVTYCQKFRCRQVRFRRSWIPHPAAPHSGHESERVFASSSRWSTRCRGSPSNELVSTCQGESSRRA